jgi:hypothetical protein
VPNGPTLDVYDDDDDDDDNVDIIIIPSKNFLPL